MSSTRPFFLGQLYALGGFTLGLSLLSWRQSKASLSSALTGGPTEYGRLWRKYIVVYILVTASDWLQGPAIYTLYRSEHHLSAEQTAFLFVLGFASAAVSSPFVGRFADSHGRKRLCQTFALLSALSSLLILFPFYPLLLVSRILGGIATSVLFSVFESWLVSSAHAVHLQDSEISLLLGRCTVANALVAVLSGLATEGLVQYSGTYKAPFVASAAMCVAAGVFMGRTWEENKGGGQEVKESGRAAENGPSMLDAVKSLMSNRSLFALALAQSAYETSMYLMVFLWVPAMDAVSRPPLTPATSTLPHGIIFSSFMLSMMLGSLLYSHLTSPTSRLHTNHAPLMLNGKLCACTLSLAGVALASSVRAQGLAGRLWSFCAFEGTVGVYYPVMGALRSIILPESSRATYAALLRIPYNVLVVFALLSGIESNRDAILGGCSGALALAAAAIAVLVVGGAGRADAERERERDALKS